MAKEAQKFSYEALVITAEKARREIATWPQWKQQAAAASFVSPRVPVDARADTKTAPASE